MSDMGTTGYLACHFTLAGVPMTLKAEASEEPKEQTRWSFDGTVPGSYPLSISNVLGCVKDDIGFELPGYEIPSALNGVAELDSLGVSFDFDFNTNTFMAFSVAFGCRIHVGDLPMAITAKASTGPDGALEFSGTCNLEIGAHVLNFSLVFLEDGDYTGLGFRFDIDANTEGNEATPATLTLSDLTAAFMSNAPTVPPLSVTVPQMIIAQASDGSDSTFLFMLDVALPGGGIDLANLPLVGSAGLPPDQSIGIEGVRVQYVSGPVDERKKGLLSKVLSELFSNEEAQPEMSDLTAGASLGVNLSFGDEEETFSLVMPESDDPLLSGLALQSPLLDASSEDADTAQMLQSFDIQKSFGPATFQRIGVQYRDEELRFLMDASLSMGGVTLSLLGLNFHTELDGLDGRFEPLEHFGIDGIGIGYDGAAEIGGVLLKDTSDADAYAYAGGAYVRTQGIMLSALGAYTTQSNGDPSQSNGDPSQSNGDPSLFVYALLDEPLGGPAMFFVTGLALGFGYNRRLIAPDVSAVKEYPLVNMALKGTKPEGVTTLEKTAEVLTALQNYLPPSQGDMFFAVGVKFTSFRMIDSFALLTVGVGDRTEIGIIGMSTAIIPTPDGTDTPAMAEIQLAYTASYLPEDGVLDVRGQLTPASYLYTPDCRLTGGFAMASWMKAPSDLQDANHEGDFVMTVGGYHPDFERPAHYPDVPRLAFNWEVQPKLTIKGDAYFAMLPGMLMGGGSLEARYKDGALEAWFRAGIDFLMHWKPYSYEASAHVSVGIKYTYHLFGTHHIKATAGASLKVWGPKFSGKAKVKLSVVKFTVGFGDSKKKAEWLTWDNVKASFLPENDEIVSLAAGDGLVRRATIEHGKEVWVINPKTFRIRVNSAIPITRQGGLEIKVSDVCVRPMKESDANSFHSTLDITMKGPVQNPLNQFSTTAIEKSVPNAIWGEWQEKQSLADAADPVREATVGVDITAKPIEPTGGLDWVSRKSLRAPEPTNPKEVSMSDPQASMEISDQSFEDVMDETIRESLLCACIVSTALSPPSQVLA